ncbi:MAG: hypothetical protein H7841_04370 [Magnetospirillum sp. WYHS-4]
MGCADPGSGWTRPQDGSDPDLALAFARCLRGRDGEWVLSHLRSVTLERACGPTVDDAYLRHLEGQRQLVSYILHMVERGRGCRPTASATPPRPSYSDRGEDDD